MIKIGAAIYINMPQIVELGVSEDYVRTAMKRYRQGESKKYANIPHPDDSRKKMIAFNSLPETIQEKYVATYGNPADVIKAAFTPTSLYKHDQDARSYFSSYKLSDGAHLSPEYIEKYSTAAEWLNVLKQADETKDFKDTFGVCHSEFNDAVIAIFRAENIDLPCNYANLRTKLRQYIAGGYETLISKKFANKNCQKLGDLQKTFLRSLYGNPERTQKMMYSQITWLYNEHAVQQGWPVISEATAYAYLSNPSIQVLLYKERHGKKAFNDKFDPIIHRSRPSHPDDMWVLDGTPFELYFRENKKVDRLYVYFVADVHSWAVLGVGIGETETQELVMDSLRRACCLTGSLPHQLQYDNSSANIACEPLFKQIAATAFPAAVGNAKSKVIEPLTKQINEQILKYFPNYAGGNINAKKLDSHSNPDEMKKIKKILPSRDQVIEQIFAAVTMWNHRTIKSRGKSPIELYKAGSPRRREFVFGEHRLRLFGNFRRNPVLYTNEGITLYINGQEVHYWVDDEDFYIRSIGHKFRVQYDRDDVSEVALYKDNRFVCYAKVKDTVPMARIDFTEGDGSKYSRMMSFKKNVNAKVAASIASDKAMLEAQGMYKLQMHPDLTQKDALNDSESMLKQIELGGLNGGYFISEEDNTDPFDGLYSGEGTMDLIGE